jgi:hypothetical protein
MPLWEVLYKMRYRPIGVDKFMHLFSGMDSIRKPTDQKASCPRPLAHQYNFWLQNSGLDRWASCEREQFDSLGPPIVYVCNGFLATIAIYYFITQQITKRLIGPMPITKEYQFACQSCREPFRFFLPEESTRAMSEKCSLEDIKHHNPPITFGIKSIKLRSEHWFLFLAIRTLL